VKTIPSIAFLETAERLDGTTLFKNHFWNEFGGGSASFMDPWRNQFMLWQHLPDVERDYDSHEVIGEFKAPKGWTIE
jgi:hypothetical protein